jgi:cation diffusion facilitator CzcD-associated flavoprotein CzcO/acetyl esterase/lipase
VVVTAARSARVRAHVRVAIVGSGFGGLGAAIRLRQAGVHDIVVFERGDDVGGTWRVNRYPGAACDVQARLYEFSFAPNPEWSRRFASQQEIWDYLRACADRFDVRGDIRFGHDVRAAVWEEAIARWHIATSRGTWTADVLVAAAGALAEPRMPSIPGIDGFARDVVHTSAWHDGVEVAGRRVAVVGTGASAVQLVPAIQPEAAHVVVFQRTPPWVVPRGDRALSPRMRAILRAAPAAHRVVRGGLRTGREMLGLPFRHPALAPPVEAFARRHLRRQVADPELRRVLTPDYRIGCKRVLLSDDWYPALTCPNVTVVDGALVGVGPTTAIGADGRAHRVDLLVLATGFRVTEPAFARRVRGRDGVLLADVWTPTMGAHLGTTVTGFPNLFVLLGPNTGLGHSSVVLMIEAQLDHLCNAVRAMDAYGAVAVEPYAEAQREYIAAVRTAMATTVWTTGGCDSWYVDGSGRNSTLWPGSVGAFRRRVAPFDAAEYALVGASPHSPSDHPSVVERVAGAVGRQLLPRLPAAVADRLAGGAPVANGARLDPASALVQATRAARGSTLTAGTPARARARHRREVLSGVGRPTPVHAVADIPVHGSSGSLPARLYRADDGAAAMPLLVYVHGGGFVLGDLDTHDEVCRLLCRGAGQHVLSVAYRLAPEHPFPAAVDDVVAAVGWAGTRARNLGADGRVTVGGDSAGATLATVAARRAATAALAAQLLIYPATDRARRWPSMDRFDGCFLTAGDVERFTGWYGGDPRDPAVSPLRTVDLRGQPPALIVTAGFDVLRDEGYAYAGALRAAGTPTVHEHEPMLGHGFAHLTQVSPAAARAMQALARRWRSLLTTGWPRV